MVKNITVKEFRDLLDELGLTHKKCGENTFRMPLPMDDDFEDTLGLSFEVRETKIQAWAAVPGFGVENPRADSLEFCNKWNREKTAPKVYIDKDGDFIAENTIFIDEEVSKDYIKNNFILLSTVAMKSFFEALNRRLNSEYDDYASSYYDDDEDDRFNFFNADDWSGNNGDEEDDISY